jgi:hypothetical protein
VAWFFWLGRGLMPSRHGTTWFDRLWFALAGIYSQHTTAYFIKMGNGIIIKPRGLLSVKIQRLNMGK